MLTREQQRALFEHNYVLSSYPDYAQATWARMRYAQNRYWENLVLCCLEEEHFHILNHNPLEAACKQC